MGIRAQHQQSEAIMQFMCVGTGEQRLDYEISLSHLNTNYPAIYCGNSKIALDGKSCGLFLHRSVCISTRIIKMNLL